MGEQERLDAKCLGCGHIWTLVYLPAPMSIIPKFTKLPCPKCLAPKPVMAEKGDLTTEDRCHTLLRRAHDAMSRREPDGITEAEWDQIIADIGKELGHA